jgi:hypothetical protein
VKDSPLVELAVERHSPGAYERLGRGRLLRIEGVQLAEELLVGLLVEPRLTLPARLLGMLYFLETLAGYPGERAAPAEVKKAYAEAIGPDFSELGRRVDLAAPDLRAHVRLLVEFMNRIRDTFGGRAIQRWMRTFGRSAESAQDAGRIVSGYARGHAVQDGALQPVLTTWLAERIRASSVTNRFGLLPTARVVAYSAALVRAMSCAIAWERQRDVTAEDLAQAIHEVELQLFHGWEALSLFADDGPESYQDLEHAEAILLLGDFSPQRTHV